jgi:hypothetical protein
MCDFDLLARNMSIKYPACGVANTVKPLTVKPIHGLFRIRPPNTQGIQNRLREMRDRDTFAKTKTIIANHPTAVFNWNSILYNHSPFGLAFLGLFI